MGELDIVKLIKLKMDEFIKSEEIHSKMDVRKISDENIEK